MTCNKLHFSSREKNSENFHLRRRHTSSVSSCQSESELSSSMYDSDSMLSFNITDEYSLQDYPSSREVSPLPLSTPRALSPACISRSNSVPDIVITINDEDSSMTISPEIKDGSEARFGSEENLGQRIRLDSDFSEIIPSFVSTPSDANTTDNVFFSDEDNSSFVENTPQQFTYCPQQEEVIEASTGAEGTSSQVDQIRVSTEMHKAKSENDLASMTSTSRLNVRAKIASHLTQRRGSIFSTLSSKLAIGDADGGRKFPKYFHKSVKGALLLRTQKERMKSRQRNEIKTAQKSSYIVLQFIALWIPLPVAVGLTFYCVSNECLHEWLQTALDIQVLAFCIGNLSATANPIIYGLAIKKFRKVFFQLLQTKKTKMLKRWKSTL